MSFELVKEVRQITGAGMSDVNKALREADGDKDKAIEILRKQGQQMADKKSARQTKEGVIAIARQDKKLAVVEIYCETDFVARNEDFVAAVQSMADKLLELDKGKFESWAEDEIKNNLIVKIGENLQLGKFDIITGDVVGFYLHSNKKVASVVVLSGGDEELAKNIAMHATAMAPGYLKPADVPEDVIAKEKEIYTEQLKKEGKPEEMIDKIMTGKIQKFYTEVCLLKQAYVKDDKQSIEDLAKSTGAEVVSFAYFSL
jgi:elongation factor Ts